MNIAILAVSGLALTASLGTLVLMAKTYKKISAADVAVRESLDAIKTKTNHNVSVAQAAIQAMEF